MQDNSTTNAVPPLLERIARAWGSWATAGDVNPQYNVASAPLLPPGTYPLFLLGLVWCLLHPRRPAAWLIPALVIAAVLPVALSDEIPHGLRSAGAFAVLPLAIGAGVAQLLSWLHLAGELALRLRAGTASPPRGLHIHRRWLAYGALVLTGSLALYGAAATRSVYDGDWLRPDRTWRVHGVTLQRDEWFFLSSLRDFAAWVNRQDTPVYVPITAADNPVIRAYLGERFPAVSGLPDRLALPPGSVAAPFDLTTSGWASDSLQYVLLAGSRVTILPPLTADSRTALARQIDSGDVLGGPPSTAAGFAATLPQTNLLAFQVQRPVALPGAAIDGVLELDAWSVPETAGHVVHLSPGRQQAFTLYWRKRPGAHVAYEYRAWAQIWTQDAHSVTAGADTAILPWLYPPTAWRDADVVPQTFSMPVPADLPQGAYQLVTGLTVLFEGAAPVVAADGHVLDTGLRAAWLKVPQATVPDLRDAAQSFEAQFGPDIVLRA